MRPDPLLSEIRTLSQPKNKELVQQACSGYRKHALSNGTTRDTMRFCAVTLVRITLRASAQRSASGRLAETRCGSDH